jgi:hypothetical protein
MPQIAKQILTQTPIQTPIQTPTHILAHILTFTLTLTLAHNNIGLKCKIIFPPRNCPHSLARIAQKLAVVKFLA